MLLFRHAYNSTNILQLINSASDIIDETLIEIVLTGRGNLFTVLHFSGSHKLKDKKNYCQVKIFDFISTL